MANPYRQNRGGKNRPSRQSVPARPLAAEHRNGNTITGLVQDSSKYWDHSEAETVEDTLIPRRSISHKQHLGLFRPDVEVTQDTFRQLGKGERKMFALIPIGSAFIFDSPNSLVYRKVTPYEYTPIDNPVEVRTATLSADVFPLVSGTDNRVIWRGDRTLLNKSFKQQIVTESKLKRITSHSKRIVPLIDTPITETIIENIYDDPDLEESATDK